MPFFVTLPVESAVAAAERVPDTETVLVSGIGSVGEEIDVELVEFGAVSRRFPYQTCPPIREAVNEGRIAFHDRNISTLGDEVQYGGIGPGDVAIVEAVAVGDGRLVPSTFIGHTPAYVKNADVLIVEVNKVQSRELGRLHDVYRPGRPPTCEPIRIDVPGDRIDDNVVRFDLDLVYFDEVIQDGLPDLLDEGQVRSASATLLVLSKAGQNRLFDAVERYAENVVLRLADVSNSPTLVDRFGDVSVNSALEIDHKLVFGVEASNVLSVDGDTPDIVDN